MNLPHLHDLSFGKYGFDFQPPIGKLKIKRTKDKIVKVRYGLQKTLKSTKDRKNKGEKLNRQDWEYDASAQLW
jgi:hypothetical protein